jgi:2',3'-cyclic-nucleotide 2'-phosphodiesterase (5'-nucleotidase family)
VEKALERGTPDMHISGMTVTYNPSSPAGKRVERMTLITGEAVTDTGTYISAVTDFLALGTGDGYRAFGQASHRQDVDLVDLEAVIKYLEALPQPVRIQRGERRFLLTPTN